MKKRKPMAKTSARNKGQPSSAVTNKATGKTPTSTKLASKETSKNSANQNPDLSVNVNETSNPQGLAKSGSKVKPVSPAEAKKSALGAANSSANPTQSAELQTLIPAQANQVTLTPLPGASSLDKNTKARGKQSSKVLTSITPADRQQGLPVADPAIKESLAKKPAGSLQSPLRIFQYYQENWQKELLDPNFVALSGIKNNSEFQEFAVFEKLAKSEYVQGAKLWGALSWRFAETTGMAGADLIKYITAHPGADVYFCNPFPHNEALFQNGWLQGETAHANFLALSQAVFQVTGLPVDELTSITSSDHYASCNYFIASPKFWNVYLAWVANVIAQANKKLPAKVRDLMHSAPPGNSGAHPGATYVTFMIERLFPVFMKTAGKSFQGHKIPLPERNRELNVHLKLLREMKDVAHKTKSAWLAACWINYRNLYCTQASGKTWCNKYLRTISPAEIKFS